MSLEGIGIQLGSWNARPEASDPTEKCGEIMNDWKGPGCKDHHCTDVCACEIVLPNYRGDRAGVLLLPTLICHRKPQTNRDQPCAPDHLDRLVPSQLRRSHPATKCTRDTNSTGGQDHKRHEGEGRRFPKANLPGIR